MVIFMSTIHTIEPRKVFHWFYQINQIPRCSGNEKRISDFWWISPEKEIWKFIRTNFTT